MYVEPQPELGPNELAAPAEVPEERRFCRRCGHKVGRSHDGRPGRVSGFCSNCKAPFDFTARHARGTPSLTAGDLVAGQYLVTRTLDQGGMGWIFLARDLNVSERPCVLKGLISEDDEAAAEAAESERRHLAELSQHPNIVTIHNFVNHGGKGYIVMEYVGGRSLKDKWDHHRKRTGAPLPPAEAISYLHAVLPAFSYMHRRNRVYCDFKPDNVMHVEDEVKLIDLGAMRRIDDEDSAVFGTPGYQAPEVPDSGPTVASDLFTIGRTLAVLTLDWPGWKRVDDDNRPLELLPEREEHPVLVEHDCIWRFLQRACAAEPGERFAGADDMADQLYGVLCQVAATVEGRAKPYRSNRWSAPRPTLQRLDWQTLPQPVVPDHPERPNRIAGIVDGDAAVQTVERLADDDRLSWADCVVTALAYCRRNPRRARQLVAELDPGDTAANHVSTIEAARSYLLGVVSLTEGDVQTATDHFDAAYALAPGEAACALAYATALEHVAERAAQMHPDITAAAPPEAQTLPESEAIELYQRSAGLYDQIVVAHPTWAGAVAGLARTLDALGRAEEAALAPLAVPESHPLRAEALTLACSYMATHRPARTAEADPLRFDEQIARAAVRYLAGTEPRNRPVADAMLAATLYRTALAALRAGVAVPGSITGGSDTERADEDALARATEAVLLELADGTPNSERRHELLDEAARVRPWTLR